MIAKMKPSVFLAAVILSATLVACGGGGGGGGGGQSAAPGTPSAGGNDDSRSATKTTPLLPPVVTRRAERSVKPITVSGKRDTAPLFSLSGAREDRRPHAKMKINGHNVIAVADTGARSYVLMDDDMARAVGLDPDGDYYVKTMGIAPDDGWCQGAYGRQTDDSDTLYQADLEIGGLRINNAYIWARKDDDREIAAPLIGNSVLSRFAMQWPYPPSSLSDADIDPTTRGEEAVFYLDSFENIPFAAPRAILVNGVAPQNDDGNYVAFMLHTGFGDHHAALNSRTQQAAGIPSGGSVDNAGASGESCFRYAGGAVTLALANSPFSIVVPKSPATANEHGIVLITKSGDNELINILGVDFFRAGVQLLAAPGPNAHRLEDTEGWRVSYEAKNAPADLNLNFCRTAGGEGADGVANKFHTIDRDCGGSF